MDPEASADTSVVGAARDYFERYLDLLSEQAESRGLTAAEVLERLKETAMFDPVVDALESAVLEREQDFLDRDDEYDRGFANRLSDAYGPALGAFRAFVDLCGECATNAYERGTGHVDDTGEVLLDLHARACLASREVLALLRNGYPSGALASWRTVHELSVIASVIAEHGRANGCDLTKRWLASDAVVHYKDAQIYQERVERLGLDPLDPHDMALLARRAEEAVSTFGREISNGNGYGWAVEVCKPSAPNFRSLEVLAGRDHLRGHYRWASHRVHGDSRGNAHNLINFRDQLVRLTGPTNLGLLDAADLTLSSLWIATNCVLHGVRDTDEVEPEEVVVMMLLGRLQERATSLFVLGDEQIRAAEDAVSARHDT